MSGEHGCNQGPILESLLTGQQKIHETLFELGQTMVVLASVQEETKKLREDYEKLEDRVDTLEKKPALKALARQGNIETWGMRAFVLYVLNEFLGVI